MSLVTFHLSLVTCHLADTHCILWWAPWVTRNPKTCNMMGEQIAIYYLSHVTCHLSLVTCHLSLVTCHLFLVTHCTLSWNPEFTRNSEICNIICKKFPFYSCHMSLASCHLSLVTCHLSPVTCHLSPVTCYLSLACHTLYTLVSSWSHKESKNMQYDELKGAIFYLSRVTCHLSLVTCHLSLVTCQSSLVTTCRLWWTPGVRRNPKIYDNISKVMLSG